MADTADHPTKLLISSQRKPISYVNICKRYLQENGEVHLSALGIAVSSMVTVAEILKNRGLAVEKSISTSLETLTDESKVRQKPKMEVLLTKSPQFDEIVAKEAAEAAEKAASGGGAEAAAEEA